MSDMLGIINFEGKAVEVSGLSDYKGIPSLSFLGRYRIIDFVLSNMSNSSISNIHIHVKNNPRSIYEHVGTGRHFNINSKRGSLHVFNSDHLLRSTSYNTDIHSFSDNLEFLVDSSEPYVLIAPSYFVYTYDYNDLLEEHLKSKADISVLYKSIDNAYSHGIGCDTVAFERDENNPDLKCIVNFAVNRGKHKNRNICLECYVMKKELLIKLIKMAKEISPFYWLRDILHEQVGDLVMNAVPCRGMVRCINDLNSYYNTQMELISSEQNKELFKDDWPIFTRTSDSPPTLYSGTSVVRNSMISNGSMIMGTVENCVVGRNVVIEEGAVVRNSIILTRTHIASGANLDCVILDKRVRVFNSKEISGSKDDIIYISRGEIV